MLDIYSHFVRKGLKYKLMIEFKLNNKQICAEKVRTYPLRALVKLKEANMETRPLGKRE